LPSAPGFIEPKAQYLSPRWQGACPCPLCVASGSSPSVPLRQTSNTRSETLRLGWGRQPATCLIGPVMHVRPATRPAVGKTLLPNRFLWQEGFARRRHAWPSRLAPAAPASWRTLSASPNKVRSSRSSPCWCSSTMRRRSPPGERTFPAAWRAQMAASAVIASSCPSMTRACPHAWGEMPRADRTWNAARSSSSHPARALLVQSRKMGATARMCHAAVYCDIQNPALSKP